MFYGKRKVLEVEPLVCSFCLLYLETSLHPSCQVLAFLGRVPVTVRAILWRVGREWGGSFTGYEFIKDLLSSLYCFQFWGGDRYDNL